MHIISDSCARIKNAQTARKHKVDLYYSTLLLNILSVLKEEGYILKFEKIVLRTGVAKISVFLKYVKSFYTPVITEISPISKPGRRVYGGYKSLKSIYGGLGLMILSSSKGVISDYQARLKGVGGELICRVF